MQDFELLIVFFGDIDIPVLVLHCFQDLICQRVDDLSRVTLEPCDFAVSACAPLYLLTCTVLFMLLLASRLPLSDKGTCYLHIDMQPERLCRCQWVGG